MLSLSRSLDGIKEANLLLPSMKSKDLVDDPLKAIERKRWKLATAYGDGGLKYHEDQAIAYVAARMPAVYSALYRVLSEVKIFSELCHDVYVLWVSHARLFDFGEVFYMF